MLASIDTIVKFLNNDTEYKAVQATVIGCGGTGKSFIINTIISIAQNMTQEWLNSSGSTNRTCSLQRSGISTALLAWNEHWMARGHLSKNKHEVTPDKCYVSWLTSKACWAQKSWQKQKGTSENVHSKDRIGKKYGMEYQLCFCLEMIIRYSQP